MKVTISPSTAHTPVTSYADLKEGVYRDDDGDYIIIPRDGPIFAVCVTEETMFSWPRREDKTTHWSSLRRVNTPIEFTISFNK